MKVLIVLFVITVIGILILYIARKNNKSRKENLNIIKDKDKLNFYLSDDMLFSIDLNKEVKITHALIRAIRDEISSLETTVRKISLINIGDEVLEKRLNRMLKRAQQKR